MAKRRILVLDDEEGIREICSDVLRVIPSVEIILESEGGVAARRLRSESFDLLVADIRVPDMSGIDVLRIARQSDPELPVLMLTAYPTAESAIECLRLGAADYITKPFEPDELLVTARRLLDEKRLKNENRLLQRHVEKPFSFDEIIGSSPAMEAIFETIRRVAATDADVLITGETGVGKELVARCIHKRSRRVLKRFVPIDCAAIPDDLLESELFGHERGAFTGADRQTMGLLEFADAGTIFLDEIGELPERMQAKLLRTLQERRFRRVGGNEEIDVNVRVLVATRRNLAEEVGRGTFREDLYYRINVVHIEVPPLRERREDIPALANYFVSRFASEMGTAGRIEIAPEAMDVLVRAQWPGNVRQLQNVIRRALALTRSNVITTSDLPDQVVVSAGDSDDPEMGGFLQLRAQRTAAFEREYLTDLLRRCHGEITLAAQQARVPRGTLYRFIKKHGLNVEDFRD